MSRSKWKGPYGFNNKKITKYMPRNTEIIPSFLGLVLFTHNGKDYIELEITSEMLGHKFGEFAFTRSKFSFKKKKTKK